MVQSGWLARAVVGLCWLPLALASARADEAGDLFAAADASYTANDFEKALTGYRGFVDKYPKDERAAMASYRGGQCLGQLKRYAEAAEAFDQCYHAFPESRYADGALFNKGYYYFNGEKWQPSAAAYFDYTKLGKRPELKAKAWFWRGEALFKMTRADDAVTAYDNFLGSPAEVLAQDDCKELVPFARYSLGVCHYTAKRWEKAQGAFKQLLEEAPTSSTADEASFYLADCSKQLGDVGVAITLYGRVVDQFPKSEFAPQALKRIAALETERGHAAAAQAATDRLLKDYPDQAKLAGEERFRLAWQQLQAKQYESAEKLYRDGLEGATGDLEAVGLLGLAEARFGQQKWPEAEAAYLLLLQKHADHANAGSARARLVEVLLRQSKFADAEKLGREYLEKAPNGTDAGVVRYNLALAVYRQNRTEEAMKLFDAVVGADPKADSAAPILLEMGRFGLETKRWPDARRAYELYLKHHSTKPGALSARWGLAQVADGEKDRAAAIAAYRSVADQAGNDPIGAEALGRLVDLYREVGQEDKAQAVGQELRRRYPGSTQGARSLLTAGYQHFNAKRYPEAIFAFEAFLREYPKDDGVPAALANLAASYYLVTTPPEHYTKAADAYRRLAKDFPTDKAAEDAQYWAAQALHQGHDDAGAMEAYQGFVAAHGTHALAPKARIALAQLLSAAKRGAEAIKVLQDAVAAAPSPEARGEARYELAWALLEAEQRDAAYEAFAGVATDLPGSDLAADAQFRLCGRLVEKGQYDKAIVEYRAWLEAHPTHKLKGRALYNVAWAQELAGQHAPAAIAFEQAEKALDDPDLRQAAVYHRGFCQLRAGAADVAVKTFDAYEQAYPTGKQRVEMLFYRGQAYSTLKKWSEAEASFKAVAKEFPEHTLAQSAQYNLGVALQNQSKYLLAADAYEPLTAAPAPGKPAVGAELKARALLQRGQCLLGAARYVDAITSLLAAEATNLDDVVAAARYFLGQCYQNQNDPKKAEERYQQVVDKHPGSTWATLAKQALAALK